MEKNQIKWMTGTAPFWNCFVEFESSIMENSWNLRIASSKGGEFYVDNSNSDKTLPEMMVEKIEAKGEVKLLIEDIFEKTMQKPTKEIAPFYNEPLCTSKITRKSLRDRRSNS